MEKTAGSVAWPVMRPCARIVAAGVATILTGTSTVTTAPGDTESVPLLPNEMATSAFVLAGFVVTVNGAATPFTSTVPGEIDALSNAATGNRSVKQSPCAAGQEPAATSGGSPAPKAGTRPAFSTRAWNVTVWFAAAVPVHDIVARTSGEYICTPGTSENFPGDQVVPLNEGRPPVPVFDAFVPGAHANSTLLTPTFS